MKRTGAALLGAILMGLSGTAQAHGFTAGQSLSHLAGETTFRCSAYQEWRLVNNAHVPPKRAAALQRALARQSVQLAQAWGTPCVYWGDSGWYLYLEPNVTGFGGHFAPEDAEPDAFFPEAVCPRRPDPSQACAEIGVGQNWTTQASHELLETLVDPGMQGYEVCDPVEEEMYLLDGVWVSDWVEPGLRHDFLHVYGAAHIAAHRGD